MESYFKVADASIDILDIEILEKIDEHGMFMVSSGPEQGDHRFYILTRQFEILDASQGKQDRLGIFFRVFRSPGRELITQHHCNVQFSRHITLLNLIGPAKLDLDSCT